MASEQRNTIASRPPGVEELLASAESRWRENGSPRWELVSYELRGRTIFEDYVVTPGAFAKVRAWMMFLVNPGYTQKCIFDDRGRNINQYWNDLENWICRYNIASVTQNLLWMAGADKHSMIPDHRRLHRDAQPKQKPPFPDWMMEGFVSAPVVVTDEKGPLSGTVQSVLGKMS